MIAVDRCSMLSGKRPEHRSRFALCSPRWRENGGIVPGRKTGQLSQYYLKRHFDPQTTRIIALRPRIGPSIIQVFGKGVGISRRYTLLITI